jgi:osmotically-inducible protein OsmY
MAVLAATMSIALACSPGEQREVREEIATAGAGAEARIEDGAVTAAVKTKLLADQMVSGMRIDVDTHDGVVVLTGTVGSAEARARANELARTTEGVVRVEDKLTMAPQ